MAAPLFPPSGRPAGGEKLIRYSLHLFHRQAGWHANPMDAEDQRVNAETALQCQDLLNHLVWRSKQEAVVHQILEIHTERVTRRHYLVLPPVLVSFVFRFQERFGEANGLHTAWCDEDLASHGEFV